MDSEPTAVPGDSVGDPDRCWAVALNGRVFARATELEERRGGGVFFSNAQFTEEGSDGDLELCSLLGNEGDPLPILQWADIKLGPRRSPVEIVKICRDGRRLSRIELRTVGEDPFPIVVESQPREARRE